MTLACLLSFAAGAVLFVFGWSYFRDLWLSLFSGYNLCALEYGGADEILIHCPPWPVPLRVLGVVSVVVGTVLLVWLVRGVARGTSRPLEAMTDIVRQLSPQNLGQRIRHRGRRSEIRELADALDDMLDRVAAGYEGQRRFASNASHELRTPLAVQRTLVEVALVTGEPELSRLAAQLLMVNERNEQLIEGLLVLAESDRGLPSMEPVRLDLLVGEVLDRFAEQAAKNDLTINRGMVGRTVLGDRVLLERLVSNLVHNAIKYNDPGGTIDVVVAGEPGLSIHNTGQRVPAEVVPALFEPFRRLTAERTHQRDGAGLGLSIVRSIVAAHNGTVFATPGDHGGLRVTVNLP
ncbi:ATP-binding protein [Actinophytocola sp.]|uniref:sensor histidine kinase n=1 Tax=Actinophytocola sp. TaxID=1872138 RepID=UPI00389A03DE